MMYNSANDWQTKLFETVNIRNWLLEYYNFMDFEALKNDKIALILSTIAEP